MTTRGTAESEHVDEVKPNRVIVRGQSSEVDDDVLCSRLSCFIVREPNLIETKGRWAFHRNCHRCCDCSADDAPVRVSNKSLIITRCNCLAN